jgi:DNA polymerase-3 subunit alpha
MEKREVEMGVQRTIQISPGFMNALRSVSGVVEVEEI